MSRRKHKQTYDGHKHRFYMHDKDQYRCSYPKCQRWYTNVNWVLRALNENTTSIFAKPWWVDGELFTLVVGYRR